MRDGTVGIASDLAPSGVLRAAINLGNPVLAQGTSAVPRGVTIDIGREIAARLGVGVEFLCFDAARDSFAALMTGQADICFLGIEPARADEVAFTAPYVLIEGVYAVPDRSLLATVADVDSPGVRIGVQRGSAYDLFLSRTLRHATVVRGAEGTELFVDREPGGGRRGPRAGDRVRRLAPRNPAHRGALHGDPAGGGHDEGQAPGDHRGSCTDSSRS